MFYVYDDQKSFVPFRGTPKPYQDLDAMAYWSEHYKNMLLLDFLAKNETDFAARAQANKELIIAHKRIEHWQKHINFDASKAAILAQDFKKSWTRGYKTKV